MTTRAHGHSDRALLLAAALLAATVSVLGCAGESASPVAPPKSGWIDDQALGPPATTPAPAPAPTLPPVPAQRKPVAVEVDVPVDDVVRSVVVVAKNGAVINAGRHRLTIPPGALTKDMVITLKDLSGSAGFVVCEALPEGLEFQKPVLLETRFRDIKEPAGHSIFWIANPGLATETWVDTGAQPNGDASGLSTWITHFSQYAPGKAGWGPRGGGGRGVRAKG
jgi:hypothetical protein